MHPMTVREIEDVSLCATRPQLVLQVHNVETKVTRETALEAKLRFRITNLSLMAATFASVNTGLVVAFVGRSCEPF